MSSKDNQRRSLAFLIIFFLGFIYIEKVLTPFMQGKVPTKVAPVVSDEDGDTGSENVLAHKNARDEMTRTESSSSHEEA